MHSSRSLYDAILAATYAREACEADAAEGQYRAAAGEHPLLVQLCLQLCGGRCGWHIGDGCMLCWDQLAIAVSILVLLQVDNAQRLAAYIDLSVQQVSPIECRVIGS